MLNIPTSGRLLTYLDILVTTGCTIPAAFWNDKIDCDRMIVEACPAITRTERHAYHSTLTLAFILVQKVGLGTEYFVFMWTIQNSYELYIQTVRFLLWVGVLGRP